MSTNNTLSAFGISWNDQTSSIDSEEVEEIHSMNAFARALREPRHSTIASSMYEASQIGQTQAEEFDDVVVDYEQGTAMPYITGRNGAMRLMTRKGHILGGDPYRLPGVADNNEAEERRAKSDSVVDYHDPVTTREAMWQSVHCLQPTIHSHEPVRVSHVAQLSSPIRNSDRDTLLGLEGQELFAVENNYEAEWEHVDDTKSVPASKFSPYESDSSPRQAGVFRSVSKRLKSALRRRRTVKKNTVSGPSNFQDLDPRYPNGEDVHPEIKAVLICEAQKRLYRQAHPEISAAFNLKRGPGDTGYIACPETRATPIENPASELLHAPGHPELSKQAAGCYPNALQPKLSKRKKPQQQRLAVLPPLPQQPRKIRVVGAVDRLTQFGDFIDAAMSSSGSEEDDKVGEQPSDGDHSILEIKPLHPKLKPLASKKVDTSRYSWVPPEGTTSPMSPAKLIPQHGWRMSEESEYPTVDELFAQLDYQVATMGIPEVERPSASREVHQQHNWPNLRPSRPMVVDDEDSDPEIIVDTFVHENHSSWIATAQPKSKAAHSRLHHEACDNFADRDEAQQLMERLRWLRAGDAV